ncbi:TonB-dependent receptor [Pedobacter cryoconitis]|uniref:TonB-linked SusC/RagA family outer membrane protein n=1 Tax=Pedobacter cryoconitis TaxID=188932 RepID=A0A7X0IZN8_9SPHI|nr:TonB-dependent receptor [Pedobacter cryoconitis]MBB6498385.1 TonB-linked SusC/RagA family outer membrane protein [Pedobacter cryoconitis]
MRITLFLLISFFVQLSFAGHAQKLTIDQGNVTFLKAIQEIQHQSNFQFVYTDEMLDGTHLVSLSFKNASLKEVLDACFKGQPLSYVIKNNNTIVLRHKPEGMVTGKNQLITVRGKVLDNKGLPLIGVTVKIKGLSVGAVTDNLGNFIIHANNSSDILVFSYTGFVSQEVQVGEQTVVNIVLLESVKSLDNIVVIGYGTQKRGDLNGAVSSISAKDIANVPQTSIDQMLQGKAAGLTITQNSGAPGSSTSVHIRGITSLSGSNEPLYVIDGVPVSGDATNFGTSKNSPLQSINNDQTAVSPLSLINPNDIESVDVLKDASAAAIYGSRASNGVIIITTKRGKNSSAKVTYDGWLGYQQPAKYLKMMDLKQYANLQNTLGDLYGAVRPEFADPSLLGTGTDWQRAIFRTAMMQSHQISVSGGKDGSNYYLSGGYLKQDGMVIGSGFDRYSFRSNVNSQVKNWLNVGMTLSGSRTNENVVLNDNNGIIYNALLSAPDIAVYNADGSYAGPPESQIGGAINPVAQALSITNNLIRNKINGNIYGDIRFSKDLSLRSELGGDFNFTDNRLFNPTYAWGRFVNTTASLSELSTQNTFWDWKEYLTYNHTFNSKHAITALLGHEVQQYTYRGVSAYRQKFFSNDVQTLNLGDAATARNDEYKGSGVLESAYARGIYTYDGKYSLTATIRADKSSNFVPGKNVGYFPSFAASWRISDESFMAKTKSVADNIKLRVGYGQVGNQDVGGYLFGSSLSPTVTGLGTGFFFNQIPNPKLTWQTSIQTDIGIDASFFDSRLDVTFDWYNKTSKNFLFQQPLPAYLVGDASYLGGINPPTINGGNLQNKGFEFTIRSQNIRSNKFRWSSTFIFSHYNNKVLSLANNSGPLIGEVMNGFLHLPVTRTVVGRSIGEFYGYKVAGTFKTDEQLRNAPVQFGRPVSPTQAGTWLGDVQYVDIDHNGKIDENDQTFLGSPNPKFTYGFTNNFTYKAFDLSVFLSGSYGAKILNVLNRTIGGLSSLYQNQLASEAAFWTPVNSTSNIPAPKGGTDNPNLAISDRYLESGSYLRIQNVSLGYNLPASFINRVKLSKLRVYASVQNLYTFTPYKGYDPEIGSANQNVFLTNIDLGRYPIPRTITFGINAEF